MMKTKVLLLCLFVSFAGSMQAQTTIKEVTYYNTTDGRVVYEQSVDPTGTIKAPINGYCKVIQLGGSYLLSEFKAGMCDGTCYRYTHNDILFEEIPYTNGFRNGIHNIYFEDGTLRTVFQYKDNKWHGVQTYYGTVEQPWISAKTGYVTTANYEMGIPVGEEISTFDNGAIHKKVPFVDGKRQGEVTLYDRDGKVIGREFYKDNALDGDCITYDGEGNIVNVVNYKWGKKDTITEYTDGQIVRKGRYATGTNAIIHEVIYKDGKPYSERMMKNGAMSKEKRIR